MAAQYIKKIAFLHIGFFVFLLTLWILNQSEEVVGKRETIESEQTENTKIKLNREETSTKCAYITFISAEKRYIESALVLGLSLAETNSRFDRIVVVSGPLQLEEKQKKRLEAVNWKVVQKDNVDNPNTLLLADRFKYTYAKLRAWEFDEYELVIV